MSKGEQVPERKGALPHSSRSTASTPEPDEGVIKLYTSNELVAPLRISTAHGYSSYYAKLVDASTGRTAMTMFIRPGSHIETKAPLGLYRLRYASGNRWQGETELFGPDTVYSEAEKTFEFRRTGDQAEGYSVRLIFQTDGNLATKLLSATQF